MSQTKLCQTKNIWFGHHPSPFGDFSTSHITNAILYVKPKLYFKSIIFVFSIVIFVKLHLGVDLQAHTSKPESELKSPTSIFQSTHTKFQGGSPMNVVCSMCWFNAHTPIFKIQCMWDNSHDVNKMHHAFRYQQWQVCWVKLFLMELKEIPWAMELSTTITILPSVI